MDGHRSMPFVVTMVAASIAVGVPVARAEGQAGWLSGDEGFAEATRLHDGRGKPILAYFYTSWCPSCRSLENNLLSSEAVQTYLGDIAAVRINAEGTEGERALAKQFGVAGYPSLYVVPDGTQQHKTLSPYRREGDALLLMSPDEFVQACRTAGERPAPARVKGGPGPRKKVARAPTARTARKKAAPPAAPAHQIMLFLKDGRVIIGELIHENPEQVTLRLDTGNVAFQRTDIEQFSMDAAR